MVAGQSGWGVYMSSQWNLSGCSIAQSVSFDVALYLSRLRQASDDYVLVQHTYVVR